MVVATADSVVGEAVGEAVSDAVLTGERTGACVGGSVSRKGAFVHTSEDMVSDI